MPEERTIEGDCVKNKIDKDSKHVTCTAVCIGYDPMIRQGWINPSQELPNPEAEEVIYRHVKEIAALTNCECSLTVFLNRT